MLTCIMDQDHWPELKYWEERPGRKCLIVDDIGFILVLDLYFCATSLLVCPVTVEHYAWSDVA